MGGNDHIPTAPREVIGDDGDLRQMRDALRAGKSVTLAYDGKVYVSPTAGPAMTPAHEQFIESKLGHVVELARSGYGVSVRPDGTISADRADHLSKVLYDPDLELSEQQRLLIQRGVSEGGQVRVHSDGRVEYFLAKDASRPDPAQVARLQQAVDAEISSGRLLEALRAGETLSANPDGSLDYVRTAPGPDPIEFPEDGGAVATLRSADLDAEALALELGVGAARLDAAGEYEAASTEAVTRRDDAARRHKAAEAGQAEAERQVTEKHAVAERIRAEQTRVAADAEQARSAGDLRRAEELSERLVRLRIEERAAAAEVSGAEAAAAAGKAEVARQVEAEARHEDAARSAFGRQQRVEDVFDQQEDQARVYRQAATELGEAERLDAAYADLEARGVAGAERVQQAAGEHRARAESLRRQAEAFDAPASAGGTGAADDVVPPVRLPPPVFDLGDVSEAGADAFAPADVDAGDGGAEAGPVATGGGAPEDSSEELADDLGAGDLGGDDPEMFEEPEVFEEPGFAATAGDADFG